jgi:hypothetical protein
VNPEFKYGNPGTTGRFSTLILANAVAPAEAPRILASREKSRLVPLVARPPSLNVSLSHLHHTCSWTNIGFPSGSNALKLAGPGGLLVRILLQLCALGLEQTLQFRDVSISK